MTKSSTNSFSSAQKDQIDPKILAQWTSKKQDRRTVIVFGILSIFFTVLGILLAALGASIQEYSVIYSENQDCVEKKDCTVDLYVEEDMPAPVYVYYRLDNFYQNHQRYITSKDRDQLSGQDKPLSELSNCYPVFTNGDAGVSLSADGESRLDPAAPAIPCGLIALTMFTDSFTIKKKGSESGITLRKNGIAWDSDIRDNRYRNIDLKRQWLDMEDERFMNWMRVAGLNDFRKLWAIIDSDLQAGVYEVKVSNKELSTKFNIAKFDTGRRLIVSTLNGFGGKNILLSVCYLLAAGLSWIILTIFLVRMIKNRKKTS